MKKHSLGPSFALAFMLGSLVSACVGQPETPAQDPSGAKQPNTDGTGIDPGSTDPHSGGSDLAPSTPPASGESGPTGAGPAPAGGSH